MHGFAAGRAPGADRAVVGAARPASPRRCAHDVERRLIPGAVLAIARGGRVGYAEAVGYRDREAGAPMALDSIFRIASMTKPMVSVAAMMLAEEGRLEIGAPVADYIPEFGELTVGAERRPARAHDDGAGSAAPHLGPHLCRSSATRRCR